MDNNIRSLLKKTLESITTSDAPVEVGPDGKDEVGLPVDSHRYIKHNCSDCFGSGKLLYIDNEHGTPSMQATETGVFSRAARRRSKVKANNVTSHTCHCVHRGYSRTRRELERRTVAELNAMNASSYSENRQKGMFTIALKEQREAMGF